MNQLKISSNSSSLLGFQLRTKLTCYFCFSVSLLGRDKLEHDSTQYQSWLTGAHEYCFQPGRDCCVESDRCINMIRQIKRTTQGELKLVSTWTRESLRVIFLSGIIMFICCNNVERCHSLVWHGSREELQSETSD